jgi:hypothetical protein
VVNYGSCLSLYTRRPISISDLKGLFTMEQPFAFPYISIPDSCNSVLRIFRNKLPYANPNYREVHYKQTPDGFHTYIKVNYTCFPISLVADIIQYPFFYVLAKSFLKREWSFFFFFFFFFGQKDHVSLWINGGCSRSLHMYE